MPRQASAEIEITPEMIEAGIRALAVWLSEVDAAHLPSDDLPMRFFREMASAQSDRS